MDKTVSIKDLNLQETSRRVNTPLSLEACKREGIDPSELLYRPLDFYSSISPSTEVQQLYYGFFEKKRLLLIETVKNTREKLAKEPKRRFLNTFSTASKEFLMSTDHQRVQDSTVKSLSRYLSLEAVQTKDMVDHHKEFQKKLRYEKEFIKSNAERDKQRFDTRKKLLEEKEKKTSEQLKNDKKQALEDFIYLSAEQELEFARQKQNFQDLEKARLKSMKKIDEHLKKVDENLDKIKEQREEKLKFKQQKFNKRMKTKEKQMACARNFFAERSRAKAEKKHMAEQNYLKELSLRRKLFEVKSAETEAKITDLLRLSSQKQLEKSRSNSQNRMGKTFSAREISEDTVKYFSSKYETKSDNLQIRLQANEEAARRSEELQRHRLYLKALNTEYNLKRKKKIKKYFDQIVIERVKQDDQKVKSIKKQKEEYNKYCSGVNQNEAIDRENMNQLVYQLKVDKNWKNPTIKNFMSYSEDPQSIIDSISIQDAPLPH